MLRGDRLPTNNPTAGPRSLGLLSAQMESFESMQPFLEGRTQAVVCLHRVGEHGIASGGWEVKHVQKCCTGWLLLVAHIRVPKDAAGAVGDELADPVVAGTPVRQVNFRKALGRATHTVDVVSSEIATEIERCLDWQVRKVLVSEGYDLAPRNEARELILACVGEAGQLNAAHFCPNRGCEMRDFCALRQQIWEGWIGVKARVVKVKWLERPITSAPGSMLGR
jgi:hypothetical protein